MGYKAIFRAKKLGTRGNVGGSANHNYRERQTNNADPARLNLNQHTGATNTAELFTALDNRLAQLDEVDPQAVPLVELLFTAAHAAFEEGGGQVNSSRYFDDSVVWAKERFGAENIIATTRHYDELTPHLVVYMVPVREIEAKVRKRSVIVGKDPETGKALRETREYPMPARSILSAKHWFDGSQKLSDMQTEFAAQVGAKHGLERGIEGSKAKHQTVRQFYANLQRPVTPIPKPPKISGMDLLAVNKILSEYEKKLGSALKPLFAKAKHGGNLQKQVNKADDYVNRASELERELEKLNAKNRQLAANFAELEQNYDTLYDDHDTLKEAYEMLQKQLELLKLENKRLLEELGKDPNFDRLSLSI